MNNMIYIEWFKIDWTEVLPIILLVILGVIIILRMIRYLTRWGPVDVSHIVIEQTTIEGIPIDIYKPINSNANTATLLFIPPLSVGTPRKNHIATAIALYNFNVILLPSKIIGTIQTDNSNTNILNQIIQQFSPKIGIAFDYSIPLILSSFQTETKPDLWVFSRPIISEEFIRPLWSMIPFSSIWCARLFYGIYKLKYHINSSSFNENEKGLPLSRKIAFIHPEKTWNTKPGIQAIQKLSSTNSQQILEDIHFHTGGWNFYFQETIWFGHLIRIIRKYQEIDPTTQVQ